MQLILTNGYPYPFPANLTPDQEEAVTNASGGRRLTVSGVKGFERVHTVTVEFTNEAALDAAVSATGWGMWCEGVLEAQTSAGDGYDHPAIIVGDTAYCGFILATEESA